MRRPPRTLASARIGAVAVLVLVLAACGDDAGDTAAADPSESPESPEPAATSSQEPSPSKTREPKPKATPPEEDLTVDVTVQGDQVSPNAEVVEVEVGEPITLAITSDRPGELHIHTSPDQYVEFGAGRVTEQFTVDRPGSVEVEEHETGAQVLRVLAE